MIFVLLYPAFGRGSGLLSMSPAPSVVGAQSSVSSQAPRVPPLSNPAPPGLTQSAKTPSQAIANAESSASSYVGELDSNYSMPLSVGIGRGASIEQNYNSGEIESIVVY